MGGGGRAPSLTLLPLPLDTGSTLKLVAGKPKRDLHFATYQLGGLTQPRLSSPPTVPTFTTSLRLVVRMWEQTENCKRLRWEGSLLLLFLAREVAVL